jgi:EpsI family protein
MTFKNTYIASAIMLLTMALTSYLTHSEDVPLIKPFNTFPKKIGEWNGQESRFDQKIYDVLGVDDSFLANYRTKDGQLVQLYIGFYQSQREGDLIHSPKNCMPGGGWNITDVSLEEIDFLNDKSEEQKAIKLTLQNGRHKQISLYWFQSRGRISHSEYMQKIYLVVDAITCNRTDGSFVRLIAPVVNNDEEAALKSLKRFTKDLIPVLKDYLPS